MNVKCPNCRFKFEVATIDVNSNNEVNCTCPRCGKSFVTQAQEPAPVSQPEPPANQESFSEPAQPQSQPQQPVVSEVDLYYSAMRCMEQDLGDKARAYVTQLLQMNPNEKLYIQLKEKLDEADEAKRREEERIKTMYFSAMKCIDSAQFEQAAEYIKGLLAVSPNDPMYQNLWNRLIEKQNEEALRQEELRRQEEARRLEEERRREEARLAEERRLKEAWLAEEIQKKEALVNNLMRGLKPDDVDSMTKEQIKESLDIINEMPDEIKPVLMEMPYEVFVAWLKKSPEQKRLWVAMEQEKLLTPEQKRQREENQLYEKAQDYINQGLFNTAEDYVNRLLEKDPNNPKYQALSQKLGNRSVYNSDNGSKGSGSGCMVVILALIVTLASLALL